MAVSPIDAAQRLRDAAGDGRLEELAEEHGLSLVVMFGSASRGEPNARDLDVAVGSRARTGLDVLTVICALMDLVGSDRIDLLDLDRAGPVARQHALVPGEPLYEYQSGEFARHDLLPSAGMRNILVHEYLEIDLLKVAAAVPLALSCYRRYVQQTAEFAGRVS